MIKKKVSCLQELPLFVLECGVMPGTNYFREIYYNHDCFEIGNMNQEKLHVYLYEETL